MELFSSQNSNKIQACLLEADEMVMTGGGGGAGLKGAGVGPERPRLSEPAPPDARLSSLAS